MDVLDDRPRCECDAESIAAGTEDCPVDICFVCEDGKFQLAPEFRTAGQEADPADEYFIPGPGC